MPTLVSNRKARFDYEILETLDAGIELLGFETKALRGGQGSLDGARVTARGGEAYLMNASITPLQPKNTPEDYEPGRNRRLLLTKKEIGEIEKAEGTKGLTIVPLEVYNTKRWFKVKIAIVRGKKKFDKRETLKRRESDRDIQRLMKDR